MWTGIHTDVGRLAPAWAAVPPAGPPAPASLPRPEASWQAAELYASPSFSCSAVPWTGGSHTSGHPEAPDTTVRDQVSQGTGHRIWNLYTLSPNASKNRENGLDHDSARSRDPRRPTRKTHLGLRHLKRTWRASNGPSSTRSPEQGPEAEWGRGPSPLLLGASAHPTRLSRRC